MKVHDHQKLIVWQKAMNMAEMIYRDTDKFPRSEIYGIVSQMRRAVVSIPSNIAEGSKRNTNKDFCHFLIISLGSCSELETQLELSLRLGFLKVNDYTEMNGLLQEIMRMLNKLISSKSAV